MYQDYIKKSPVRYEVPPGWIEMKENKKKREIRKQKLKNIFKEYETPI